MGTRRGIVSLLILLTVVLLLVSGGAASAPGVTTAQETDLVAVADADISSDSPAGNNGSANGMLVGYNGYPGYGKLRALVRFDTSALPVDAIVDEAALKVWVGGGTRDAPMLVTAYGVSQAWTETGVTWNSHAESRYGASAASVTLPHAADWGYEAQWNIRALVQQWLDTTLPNYGVMLIGDETESGQHVRYLETRESATASRRPVLHIRWHRPATPTPTLTPTITLTPKPTPTRRPTPSQGVEVEAGADATLSSPQPADNFGLEALVVEYMPNPYGPEYAQRALLRFDLGMIPRGSVVDGATLYLYLVGTFGYGPRNMLAIAAHRVTADWSEMDVTWNSHVACMAEAYDSRNFNVWRPEYEEFEPRFADWDVRDLVQAWVNGTYLNNGIALVGGELYPDEEAGRCYFASREWPIPWERPYLWVRWHAAPTATPTATATTSPTPTATPTATPRGREFWLPLVTKG